ncbi:hypothetical protein AAG570_003018 [Ranatra chinensis]|uniref:G-protein coupled receptors family 1 profile domain-containing protein n=1 Tax=Ranatra chinensis TaxID=642074 RepID=A0ABD0Y668_9HEMI
MGWDGDEGNLTSVNESETTTYADDGEGEGGCPTSELTFYEGPLGVSFAVPFWEAAATALVLSLIILVTIVGNILVILSVFTYRPLRIVQNFFIVSLAVADLTVALLVLPFNVAYSILGRWVFGIHVCKMWLTSDVMCCTASILNLCAIALDRYWAITDPINYARKRSLKRVLLMIGGVWILSGVISSPPLAGWNDWPEVFHSSTPCQLTSQQGYVIYSSLGSFYIPLLIMTIVYAEIFVATRRRLRERARASKLNAVKQNERRAARTLGIIMGVFVVCWLPFFLMYVILPFCSTCCPSDKLINFITWLGYINSALNPIIYTIFNLDFRRAFKKLLHIKSAT